MRDTVHGVVYSSNARLYTLLLFSYFQCEEGLSRKNDELFIHDMAWQCKASPFIIKYIKVKAYNL